MARSFWAVAVGPAPAPGLASPAPEPPVPPIVPRLQPRGPLGVQWQYYDAETDLFENWNRFYDPSIGRYLSPDPILMSPGAVVSAAAGGMITPASSALSRTDPLLLA